IMLRTLPDAPRLDRRKSQVLPARCTNDPKLVPSSHPEMLVIRSLLARHRVLAAVAVLFFAVAARADDDDHGQGRSHTRFSAETTGKTVRMIVRPSIAGDSVRVKIENTQATTPVTFSGAFIGVLDSGAALASGSNRRLTFGGKSSLTLAAGAGAYSDAVKFKV